MGCLPQEEGNQKKKKKTTAAHVSHSMNGQTCFGVKPTALHFY